MSTLAERLVKTREDISSDCVRLSRPEPTLIVVTKNHPVELVLELYGLGERNFGENRTQEGYKKFQEFQAQIPNSEEKWHLIGQLQTNKVKQALEFAHTIHSLDRESLLLELARRTVNLSDQIGVFIQVNLTDDPDRGGLSEGSVLDFADKVVETPSLKLLGLMAVATLDGDTERDFERVAKLSKRLTAVHPNADKLSIGMSNDYVEALQYGATHLRIGTAITGNRSY